MANLTRRSLFKVGDGGLAVTIPKSWWSYYHLKPGDKVEVVTDGILKIRPEPTQREKVTTK